MNNSYHVLWIDDEWDIMSAFIQDSQIRFNIELTPYKTQKEGLDALTQNPAFWDAILLDAEGLDEDLNEDPVVDNLYKTVAKLQKEYPEVPFFISTGVEKLVKQDAFNSYCNAITLNHKFYTKGADDEILRQDIIRAIELQPQRTIKNKYSEIFSWLPIELYKDIIDLLSIIEDEDNTNADVFNKVRKVLDWTMKELNTYGILTIEFNGTNLNECSGFLGNKDLQEYIPLFIQRHFHSCCNITNEGSHRLIIDDHVRNGKAPYLTRTTVYELLNILMWFHQLPSDDEKKRKITNLSINVSKKIKEADNHDKSDRFIPELDSELKVWHCGDTMINAKEWGDDEVILFDIAKNTDKKYNHRYPKYAKYRKA